MNYRMIRYTLGWLMLFEAGFLLLPLITALCYGEITTFLAFLYAALICLFLGGLCILKSLKRLPFTPRKDSLSFLSPG